MAKAPEIKVDIDFTNVIAQLGTIADVLITMGESMVKLGEEINNGVIELKLQEMTK